mgnify:FL=1
MGGQFEVKDGATKKYYSIAGMMVATQDASGLQYLLTDHLGSTVAVTNTSGTLTSQQRYLPFGEVRQLPNYPTIALTDYGYTGQRKLDDGMGGIMDYKARFYSVGLGRFIQPDSIIPSPANPQSWNRYSYVLNRPISFNDPTGHESVCGYIYSDPECEAPDPWTPLPAPGNGDDDGGDEGDQPDEDLEFTELPVGELLATEWFGPTNFAYNNHLNGDEWLYDKWFQGWHGGIDFFTHPGAAVMMAVNQDGVVVRVRPSLVGQVVYVDYGDLVVVYQHVDTNLVIGNPVSVGSIIGTVTNNPDGGHHVHIEVRNKDQNQAHNPLKFMNGEMTDYLLDNFDDPYPDEFALGYPEEAESYTWNVIQMGGCNMWTANNCSTAP